ncbi:PREDICTED: uncharacterized protein LOC106107347 [Papilio polytes]|uniref:uncharacterized protein LOC106107347 n=1 Tax=Papilio polytes TaxID=76194 RepID=UPI0006763E66|nr:PREDICTED: uncharacterized protein LOC106107347 [Papilio polytes]
MDLTVDQYMEGLLSKEAYDHPSDSVKLEKLELTLPDWYDEKLFKKGQRFFWKHCFGLSFVMMPGLVAVFAVPTILEVLADSGKSSSKYTAFKRYVATFLHFQSWLTHDLKPGSESWRSLYAVRSQHLRNGRAARLKKKGTISQRDLALTQFGVIGLGILKPDRFGVRQEDPQDWEGWNHFWGVVGYMIGLEDKYNMCRRTMDETRQVCRMILDQVYTPCLENVPEYFEHMSRVMLDGMWAVNGATEAGSLMYVTKNLADVPGYILTESERIALQTKLRKLAGTHEDRGVDVSTLVQKCRVDGLPDLPPRFLYLKDFDSLESVPEYKKLSYASKYKLAVLSLLMAFYSTNFGRFVLNLYYKINMYMAEHFPYVAFFLYGIKKSYVDIFKDPEHDNTRNIPNSEYKNQSPEPWYKVIVSFW